MRIIAISDTHTHHNALTLPPGDVLVHAGDITRIGSLSAVVDFNAWLGRQPYQHKLIIAGNHDFCFEQQADVAERLITNGTYLRDQAIEIDGIKFYGSPWQPWFFGMAFNLHEGPEIAEKWQLIPADTDVLITHGPPRGHGDRTQFGRNVGCVDLLDAVQRIKPRYHIFGHIHEAYGATQNEHTRFLNASAVTLGEEPISRPHVIDIEPRQ